MTDELGSRRVHHWVGRDRAADIAALADAIAVTVPGLCNHGGGIAQLDPNTGQLLSVNLANFRELIGQHLCGERVVPNGSGWKREYFAYQFAPAPRPGPPTQESGLPQQARTTGPDDKVLRQIYLEEVVQLVPRVEA
jgi:hypothetical protein